MALRPPVWIDGVQVAGTDLRLADSGLLTPRGPLQVRNGALGAPVRILPQPTPNMTVTIGPFVWVVSGSGSGTGQARIVNDATVTLTVDPASATNPRRDAVVIEWVGETQPDASLRGGAVRVVTGTPATTPQLPAVTGNVVVIGEISVPAKATSIGAANITSYAQQTVAVGGVAPSRNAGDVAAIYPGQVRVRLDTSPKQLEVVGDSGTWEAPGVGATAFANLPPAGGWKIPPIGTFPPPAYQRDADGWVSLRGAFQNTLQYPPAGGQTMGTLPAGFRLPLTEVFLVSLIGPGGEFGWAHMDVRPDGRLLVIRSNLNPILANTTHFLSGVRFLAA